MYSKAIALEPSCEVYFSNRAAAYAGLQRWREALDDSNEAVTLKPEWVKGWVRKGAALTGMGKHEEARKAYLKATQLEPGNSQLVQKMEAAAAAAATDKEKRWEDDFWSDDEAPPGEHSAETAAAKAGHKRAAVAPPEDFSAGDTGGAKRTRRRPSASLLAQLDRSLKDASEDSMRACLAQIAGADEELCERALHILEGLNAASSEGSVDEDEDEGGGAEKHNVAAWLRRSGAGASGGGGLGGARGAQGHRHGRAGDSDSD